MKIKYTKTIAKDTFKYTFIGKIKMVWRCISESNFSLINKIKFIPSAWKAFGATFHIDYAHLEDVKILKEKPDKLEIKEIKEFNEITLTNGGSTKLEIGDVNLISCYGASGNNKEFYLNNTLLEDTTDYVIHKTLEFETNQDKGKLKISEINVSDDTLAKAICLKAWVGDEFCEIRGTKNFEGYTFNSVDTCDIYVWVELGLIMKDEILASKGADIEIMMEVE